MGIGGITTLDVDSPLGRWRQSSWRPSHLAGLVDVLWHSAGSTTHPRERVLPGGTVELVVILGAPTRLVEGDGPSRLVAACLTGLQTSPMVLEHPARHDVLAIRLRPAGAWALLGRPMHELADRTVELHDLVGRAGRELAERCHDAATAEARFRCVADWFLERSDRTADIDRGVAWATSRIEATGGTVPIRDLRAEVGVSKARLTGVFREQVGVAPKLYARIVRFRRVLDLLRNGGTSLAEVALAAGYYDQPHMTAEFRELGGITPRDFVASHYPDGLTAFES